MSLISSNAATVEILTAARTVTPAEDLADHTRAWQLAFADNESDWDKRQQMYADNNAPYSRRLFAHDMFADERIATAAASFLSLEGPLWKDSPAAKLLPDTIAKTVHRKAYGVDAIEIPAGADLYGVLEDLSRIWLSTCEDDQALRSLNIWVLADKAATVKAYQKAKKAGVLPMLSAWEAGVPLDDIVI